MYRSDLEPKEVVYEYFHFVPLDEKLLEKMYIEFHEEIPDEKYRTLKYRTSKESTDRCYAVLDDECRIYGHYCLSLGDNHEPFIDMIIPANKEELYLFDDYTFIKRRGKRAHQYSILKRQDIAREMGYKAVTAMILKGNTPSERAFISSGFKRIKKVDSFRILNKKGKLIRYI